MCTSSQFGKECTILGKIPLGTYLNVFTQLICRETLITHLLWLGQTITYNSSFAWSSTISSPLQSDSTA